MTFIIAYLLVIDTVIGLISKYDQPEIYEVGHTLRSLSDLQQVVTAQAVK